MRNFSFPIKFLGSFPHCGKWMRFDGLYRRSSDESVRAQAMAPWRNMFHSSGVRREEIGPNHYTEFGRPLNFPGQRKREKMVVAVDVDEVLGSFLPALNKFIADHYSSHLTLSEYYVYEFFKIWNCTQAEAQIRVHEFFKTPYFTSGIDPIPGAHTVLSNVTTFCSLSVVTSRQNIIKDHTCDWIEKHYPGLFKEIRFGNHFALDGGKSMPKSEICRSLGAQVLIDDNPEYALECAKAGIRVLLFDYCNSYPWCKGTSVDSHNLVTKVHSWQEVEQCLASLAVH